MNQLFNSRHFKVFVVVAAIAAPIFILSLFSEVFLLLVVSVIATMILKPVVDYFENKGWSRILIIIILYLVLGGIVALGLWFGYPFMLTRLSLLTSALGNLSFAEKIKEVEASIAQYVPFLKAEDVGMRINTFLAEIARRAEETLSSAASLAIVLVIVPFVTFFLLKDYDRMKKRIIQAVPNKYFEMALNLFYKLERQLSRYIRGVFLESLAVAILYAIAYKVIGLDFPIILGIIGGVFNIISIIGPIIGATAAFVISIVQTGDFSFLISIVVVTIIVQQIDEIIVQPNVYGKLLDLHPLTVIIAVLLGSQVMGLFGMVLAIPIYSILTVTAKQTHWGLKNYRITGASPGVP
ncbi:MAG TPA: AI-2E family transporter [Bacteroidota bacterium]